MPLFMFPFSALGSFDTLHFSYKAGLPHQIRQMAKLWGNSKSLALALWDMWQWPSPLTLLTTFSLKICVVKFLPVLFSGGKGLIRYNPKWTRPDLHFWKHFYNIMITTLICRDFFFQIWWSLNFSQNSNFFSVLILRNLEKNNFRSCACTKTQRCR